MTATPLEAIDGGRAPDGWERLWASDRWPLRELPHSDLHSTARAGSILFSGIPQPWFKEAAKRWARARLLAGAAPTTMHNYVQHVSTFGAWLADRAPAVSSPAHVTRAVLEDWLLAVRSSGLAAASKANRVTVVRLFLEEQWQDGLAGLPRTAVIHVGEVPHNRSRRLPRGIEAPVFEQFIDPANLALLPCEQHRTVILLLAFTGLRVSSIVTLPRDALVIGSDNHPYLHYVNVKLRREAVIPIGPTLVEQLRRQEESLTTIYGPEGTSFLLPSPPEGMRGPSRGGGHHITPLTARRIVKAYVRKAEIRDSQGRLAVWVHPHRLITPTPAARPLTPLPARPGTSHDNRPRRRSKRLADHQTGLSGAIELCAVTRIDPGHQRGPGNSDHSNATTGNGGHLTPGDGGIGERRRRGERRPDPDGPSRHEPPRPAGRYDRSRQSGS